MAGRSMPFAAFYGTNSPTFQRNMTYTLPFTKAFFGIKCLFFTHTAFRPQIIQDRLVGETAYP